MAEVKVIKQKFIIDESGSMGSQQMTVINGFNEQLDDMKREEEEQAVKYLVTLVKFSHEVTKVFENIPLADVPRLTKKNYKPSGSTALYDAIGQTISSAAPGETDVIVTIMTDGEENASVEFKKPAIQTLIKIRQDENKWGFVYLGANQDAWSAAQSIGVQNALNYTMANTDAAFRSMSTVRSCYVSEALCNTYNTSSLTCNVNKDDLVK